jgi:hypothetical protein
VAVVVLAMAGCATAARPAIVEDERAFYLRTVAGMQGRLLAPEQVDYQRLRRAAYLGRTEEQAAGVTSLAQTLASARDLDDQPTVQRAVYQILALDFTDAEAHLEMARSIHYDRHAAFHEAIALGVLRSILGSGTGSPERPFQVFGPREEEAVAVFLDLQLVARRTRRQGGRVVEELFCRDRAGATVTLHFELSGNAGGGPPGRSRSERVQADNTANSH